MPLWRLWKGGEQSRDEHRRPEIVSQSSGLVEWAAHCRGPSGYVRAGGAPAVIMREKTMFGFRLLQPHRNALLRGVACLAIVVASGEAMAQIALPGVVRPRIPTSIGS